MLAEIYFICSDKNHEAYRTGKIKGRVSESVYLCAFDIMHPDKSDPMPNPPHELITLTEMTARCDDCNSAHWEFFDTAADRRAWLDWMERPLPKAKKVVKLVPSGKH